MKLHPGQEQEYRRRHDAIWPDLVALLKEAGITNYSIFLDAATHSLFGVLETRDQARLEHLPQHPLMQQWWAYMADIMETKPDQSPVQIPLESVFYLP